MRAPGKGNKFSCQILTSFDSDRLNVEVFGRVGLGRSMTCRVLMRQRCVEGGDTTAVSARDLGTRKKIMEEGGREGRRKGRKGCVRDVLVNSS